MPPLPHCWDMLVIDETDEHGGLARAALALTTAIANEVRKGAISLQQARTVFKTARWLVHDRDSFAENARTAEAADNFLTVSEAVIRNKYEQGQVR
jgi:hypothetical protein